MGISRRQTLQAAAVAAFGGIGCTRPADRRRSWPDESRPHERTYMAWPTRRIWGSATDGVREDIARIARAVADFEPVTLLANRAEAEAARRACGSGVEVVPTPVDDLWMRDTGPTFVRDADRIAGVDLNFNGWGGKQEHARDGRVARAVLEGERVRRIKAPITAEGGALETDGQGTLLVTESSLVDDARNPGMSRNAIEGALKDLFGVTTVIWVKGVRGEDITDYHIDALARFSEPGVVVMSTPPEQAPRDVWTAAYDQARKVLDHAVDARGKRLEVVELPEPVDIGRRGDGFLACYVNYYVVNGAVIMPRFGDRKADDRAASIVRDLYPGREVVPLPVDHLGEGGGGIHCSTQQMPEVG